MKAFILIMLLVTFSYAQQHSGHGMGMGKESTDSKALWLDNGLGNVDHPVTTKNAEAQKWFNQGLAYLFAFNHEEAVKSFLHATELDLPLLVQRVVKETSVVTEGRVVATVRPSSGEIYTDEQKLQRVLVNLIENAAKYAPDGPIEIDVMAAGARVVFFVTDHGPGIAPQDRERVFERFVQLDQSHTRARGDVITGRSVAGRSGSAAPARSALSSGDHARSVLSPRLRATPAR